MTITITNAIIAAISEVGAVERVAEWSGRYYVSIAGARTSRAKADNTTKIWIKGSTLTVDGGRKGYHSEAFIEARDAVVAAALTAGATVVGA